VLFKLKASLILYLFKPIIEVLHRISTPSL
jgi:hypothetical protein